MLMPRCLPLTSRKSNIYFKEFRGRKAYALKLCLISENDERGKDKMVFFVMPLCLPLTNRKSNFYFKDLVRDSWVPKPITQNSNIINAQTTHSNQVQS